MVTTVMALVFGALALVYAGLLIFDLWEVVDDTGTDIPSPEATHEEIETQTEGTTMTNPLRWLRNVVTRRYAHWNDTHNKTLKGLLDQASTLPQPAQDILYQFLVSSWALCNRLLGPDSPDPLIDVDLRRLDAAQFHRLYAAQTAALAGSYAAINPQFSELLMRGLSELFPSEPAAERFFRELVSQMPPDLASFGPMLWEECLEITGGQQRVTSMVEYTMLLGLTAIRGFSELKTNPPRPPPANLDPALGPVDFDEVEMQSLKRMLRELPDMREAEKN